MNASEFASRILQILDSTSSDASSDQLLSAIDQLCFPNNTQDVATSRAGVDYAAEIVNRRLTDVSSQVQERVSVDQPVLVQHILRVKQVIERIQRLEHSVDESNKSLLDSADGLVQKLNVIETEDEKVELDYIRSTEIVILLKKLQQIRLSLDEFNQSLSTGKVEAAASKLIQIEEYISELPSSETNSDVPVFRAVRGRATKARELLQLELEIAVSMCVIIDISRDNSQVHCLTIHSVSPDKGIPVESVLSAAIKLNYLSSLLAPIASSFLRVITIPLIKGSDSLTLFDLKFEEWPTISKLMLVPSSDHQGGWMKKEPTDLLNALGACLAVLDTGFLGVNVQATSIFGELIWRRLAASIIEDYASKMVPTDASELRSFENVASVLRSFELKWRGNGWIPQNQLILSEYCDGIDVHFAERKHESILSRARDIILKDDGRPHTKISISLRKDPLDLSRFGLDVADQFASPPVPQSNLVPEIPDNLFEFPSCNVNQSALDLLIIVEKALDEASKLNTYCSTRQVYTALSCSSLYVSITLSRKSFELESDPEYTALFHNSCMYLTYKSRFLALKYARKLDAPQARRLLIQSISHGGLGVEIADAGIRMFNNLLQRKRDSIVRILATPEGFDVIDDDRYAEVESAIYEVVAILSSISMAWRDVLPCHVYLRSIGLLLTTAQTRAASEVLSLVDIGDSESHRLHSLLSRLDVENTTIIELFQHPSLPPQQNINTVMDFYITNRSRFVKLSNLLVIPFKDLMDSWRAGELREFSVVEMIKFVKALFADTPLRVKNLEEIGRGNPKINTNLQQQQQASNVLLSPS